MFFAPSRRLRHGINILFWATSALVLAALIWGLDKGFDVTDEAYYLLGLLPGQEKLSTFTALQFTLFSRILGWLDGVIVFRVLSLAFTLVAASCFAWGFVKLVRHWFPTRLPVSTAALCAWLVGGSFFIATALTLTFSYNIFMNGAMLAQGGLVFYALASSDAPTQTWRRRAAWAAVGLLTCLGLLVKTPAAFAIWIVLAGGGLVYHGPDWRTFFKEAILPCLLGGLTGLLIALALQVVQPILDTLQLHILHPGHRPTELLTGLWLDLKNFTIHLSSFWLPVLAAFSLGSWAARRNRRGDALPAWLVLLIFLAVMAAAILSPLAQNAAGRWMRLPVIYLWTGLFAILAALLLPGFLFAPKDLPVRKAALQKGAVYAMLFLLAPAAAFGTNNTLVWQIWLHITPWMALLFWLFLETQRSPIAWPLGWAALVFAVVWVWAGWSYTYFMLPYRLLQNRLSQTEPLAVRSSHFSGLKVDAGTRAFFEGYDALLATAKSTPEGVIAIFDMPGLVYLSDGVSPGDIWYQEGDDRNLEIAGYIQASMLSRKSSFILMNTPWSELPDSINQALIQPDIDFPAAYRQIGRFDDPINKRNVTLYERRR